MVRILVCLPLWKKFTILGLLGLVLVSVPFFLYVRDSYKNLEVAQMEARGVAPAKAMLRVIQLTQQDRGLSALVLAGNGEKVATLSAKQTEVEQAWQTTAMVYEQTVHAPDVLAALKEARESWNTLRREVTSKNLTAAASTANHTQLIVKLMGVLDQSADYFGLTLDPDTDSYYLIVAALYQLPGLAEDLGRMRAHGAGFLEQHAIAPEERVGMANLLDRAHEHHASMSSAFVKVGAANPALKEKLQEAAANSLREADQVMKLADAQLIKPETLSYSGVAYVASFTKAIDAQFKLLDVIMGDLEQLIQQRAARLNMAILKLGILVALLSSVAAWVGFLITASITRPLRRAVDVARAIAKGDLGQEIVVDRQEEVGQLLSALKEMNDALFGIVHQVRSGAESIATASTEIANGNQDLSVRTEHQASSLQETAASMEELTHTVENNDSHARRADVLAASASAVASKGGANCRPSDRYYGAD